MISPQKPKNQTRVIVGMSGGVDSSLTAVLLVEQGYQVEGVFMQNWDDDDEFCTIRQDYKDASAVCQSIGIELQSINFAREYWDRVFEHFLQEYSAGRTPNPDILCNKEIKFKAFLDWSIERGADYIATGHYARIKKEGDAFQMLRGIDDNKDQTYFLYTLGQKALSKTLFPIGEMEKSEVRDLAKKHGLHVFSKKDSTGICFIGERKFSTFLSEYLPHQPGNIVSDKGDILATHQGLMYYTLGQRQGLGIGGLKNNQEGAWYVIDKKLESNELIVGQGHDHPGLLFNTLRASQVHWTLGNIQSNDFDCSAKVRYRQKDVPCHVSLQSDGSLSVHFIEKVRAITPGQAIVFYDNDICLGGATIDVISNQG